MGIRCLVHVLQLCVWDTLKNSWSEETHNIIETYMNVIRRARQVVKELRTQTILILLVEKKLKKPSLDIPTRWGSTYLILESLLSLKEFCSTCVNYGSSKLLLTKETWTKISEIVLCLEHLFLATKKVQSQNNTLTDLYKIWHMCHLRTAEIDSPFSQELITNMIKRRDSLMENAVMLSALYLDPRFSFELTECQKQIAVAHMCDVQRRLITKMKLEGKLHDEKEIVWQSSDTDSIITKAEDEELRYEKILRLEHRQYQKQKQNRGEDKQTFRTAF